MHAISKFKWHWKASLPLWGLALVIVFGTTTLMPSPIRLLVFVLWLAAGSWMLGVWIDTRSQARRFLFGSCAAVSIFGLALTALALAGHFTVVWVSVMLILFSMLFTCAFDGTLPKISSFTDGLTHAPSFPYLLIALFGDAWIFINFYNAWTAEPLVSPWQLFNFVFFLVFAVTTFAVVLFAATRRDRASLLLSSLHLFVSLSAAVMLYGIGFGFDPFIHRAAEMALVRDGVIEPRRLLYLGQYALVGGANLLTGVQVILLDKWLVPLLASITIPVVAFLGLRDGFGLTDKTSRVFLHFALFFPAMYFVFTVPFNLTLLFLLLVTFVLPLADTWRSRSVLMLLGLFSLCVHPLGGIPILLLLGLSSLTLIEKPRLRQALLCVGVVTAILALPLLFALYNITSGHPPISVQPQFLYRFFALFTDPYLRGALPIPFFVELFYDLMRWVPRIVVVCALFFAWRQRTTLAISPIPTLLLTGSLLGSLFLLSGFFTFADVIQYEQMEFAWRLLQTIFLMTTTWALVFLAKVWKQYATVSFAGTSFFALLMAIFITATWYLSYPQLNLKVQSAGASVSAADVEVARFLESRHNGEPHLVLSHQMTSAAAIQESGFRHYLQTDDGLALWYAVPTGGTLYGYFLRMSTEGPSPALLSEIQEFANVRHVYFVTYDSWPNAGFIRSRAASFASASYGVQGTKLVVYEYRDL